MSEFKQDSFPEQYDIHDLMNAYRTGYFDAVAKYVPSPLPTGVSTAMEKTLKEFLK